MKSGLSVLPRTQPRLVRGQITYVAGTTGAIGATTLFTVTGDVKVVSLNAKCTTNLTSAGAPTFDLGVTGSTSLFGSGLDVTGWQAGRWLNGTSGSYAAGGSYDSVENANSSAAGSAGISANILQTIAVAPITGGVVRWYLEYVPLSGDGLVTLHANLVAF